MAARPISSASISFGLVAIPVNLYAAASPRRVVFATLHKTCGAPVQQRMICPVEGVAVDRTEISRGFEHAKNQYVMFTDDELTALEADRTGRIELREFVPASTVDLRYIESTHYLGTDKKNAKAYQLLAQTMKRRRLVGIGRYANRGKDSLVIVRPYKTGLVLHEVFYADETRSFEDIEFSMVALEEEELLLSGKMIDRMSSDRFQPEKYSDKWRDSVQKALLEKASGACASPPMQPLVKPHVMDLLEALKRSVSATDEVHPPSARPGPAKTKAKKKDRKKHVG